MDWFSLHPEDLIERCEPVDLLTALRSLKQLDPTQAQKLDPYLDEWTLTLLTRPHDADGVQEMLSLCELAHVLLPQTPESAPLRHRWQAFENLLEGKRLRLQAQASEPAAKLLQQDKVLDCIRAAPQGRIRQQDLAHELSLSKGRISQILGVLEERGHLTRQRQGRESWVSLLSSQTPPAATPITPPSASTQPMVHLGARVFALHKAAA
jgi:hypothetical protein